MLQNYSLTVASIDSIVQPAFSDSEVREFQDAAFEAAIAPVRVLLKKKDGVNAYEVRLIGDPGDELSAYAKERLDLLVLGSHGYGAFKAAVMGSVATRVTAHCTVPLLLVRD